MYVRRKVDLLPPIYIAAVAVLVAAAFFVGFFFSSLECPNGQEIGTRSVYVAKLVSIGD